MPRTSAVLPSTAPALGSETITTTEEHAENMTCIFIRPHSDPPPPPQPPGLEPPLHAQVDKKKKSKEKEVCAEVRVVATKLYGRVPIFSRAGEKAWAPPI